MNACLPWSGSLAALVAMLALALPTRAAEPSEKEPKLGIGAGETMPFFVADFCHGEHKDHAGCPGVIISNHGAKGVIILAQTIDEGVIELARELEEKKLVDAKTVLSFIIKTGDEDAALAERCTKAGLKTTDAGTLRDQSLQRLVQNGLSKDTAVAVLFLDRKAVKGSHLLKAGELTPDKRQELIAAAEKLYAAK
jgi:hypothetical protein